MFRFSLAEWSVMEWKKREAYFSLQKFLATILGLAEVTRRHFVHSARILAHVFHAFLLQFSFFFLVYASVRLSHPPHPCFWYLDFLIPLFSTYISNRLSCLKLGMMCTDVFMYQKMFAVCRLSLAIIYWDITAVLCYFLFSPWGLTKREFWDYFNRNNARIFMGQPVDDGTLMWFGIWYQSLMAGWNRFKKLVTKYITTLLQTSWSVEMNFKRTTSPKRGKDWVLVKFEAFNPHFLC